MREVFGINYKVFKVRFRTDVDESYLEYNCFEEVFKSENWNNAANWVNENEKFDGEYFIIKGY